MQEFVEVRMSTPSVDLYGLLVSYNDDQLDDCVRLALKRKSRVRYKCMDTFSNFLAFGTTSGAIYLFKLKSVSHSSCHLVSIIPCDQGSIEVIKFLPNPQTDDLLVAIGTSRGSLIIFKLNQLPGEEDPSCNEIYRAEAFTNQEPIKSIECDQDLIDLTCPFTKLYICDTASRIYVLDSNSIYGQKQSLISFYSSNLPALIFSSNDFKINQISVNRSQLLISTDETTMLFNEQIQQVNLIGKKKRKEGFYGACFFNPGYKPARIIRMTQQTTAQNTSFSSMNSISDVGNLYMFVARPVFRLWQVNTRRDVMFTHQFEPLIKCDARCNQLIEISNEPLNESRDDDPREVLDCLGPRANRSAPIRGDHFERLIQIYSSILGNLLLSYTRHEIFVIDPIGAKLIVWHQQDEPIIQVSCNENEVFVWSMTGELDGAGAEGARFRVKRMIIMATTQFVLELHRLHRFTTIVYLVEIFEDLFRQRMALPLSGSHVITTEGGLLRNVLLNAWEMYQGRRRVATASTSRLRMREEEAETSSYERCIKFKGMIDEILDESRRLKDSYADLTDSRFFLTMTNENIDRLCTEPYASLISLEVSIKDLHTTHVIHFNKDAVERRKSVANLSQSIQNLARLSAGERKLAKSSLDLRRSQGQTRAMMQSRLSDRPLQALGGAKSCSRVVSDVTREPLEEAAEEVDKVADLERMLSEQRRVLDSLATKELLGSSSEEDADDGQEESERRQLFKCPNCGWPRPKSHLQPLSSKQRIQLKCIEENLVVGFAENMAKIEELAFQHALWSNYLKCLASRNALDDYILCCMMLDDARLFDLEQFLIVRGGEEEILNRVMIMFKENPNFSNSSAKLKFCVRCKGEAEAPSLAPSDQLEENHDDSLSFSLVNLLEQFIMRRNANVPKIIDLLLKYTDLLNTFKIPSSFYLKAIATAALVANQSPLNRARLSQLRAMSFAR